MAVPPNILEFCGVMSILGGVSPTGWDEKTLNDERWFPKPQLQTTTICGWQYLPKVFALVEKTTQTCCLWKIAARGRVSPNSGSFKSNLMNTWFMWGKRGWTLTTRHCDAMNFYCFYLSLLNLLSWMMFRILFTRNVDPKAFPGTGNCFCARVVLVAGAFSDDKIQVWEENKTICYPLIYWCTVLYLWLWSCTDLT